MSTESKWKWAAPALGGLMAMVVGLAIVGMPGQAQQQGEWTNINGSNQSTRYSTVDQINASNFNNLKVAWEWRGEVPGMEVGEINGRGLPIYADGMLVTTSGPRRTVVAMDPATGKTVWAFQEPLTPRHEYSMRSNHGKGVTYTKINGKGVVIIVTPGFFAHVLDIKTGKPIEGWGGAEVGVDRPAEGPHRRLGTLDLGQAAV
jgi:quinoprotein glucose dehydrogenase